MNSPYLESLRLSPVLPYILGLFTIKVIADE